MNPYKILINNLHILIVRFLMKSIHKDQSIKVWRLLFMSYLLEIRELTKRYKKQYANDKLNMCVEEGCIYGLLGPNGAGKSTLLKMITGMAEPTSGSIFFSGEVMTRKDLTQVGALIENAPVLQIPFGIRSFRTRK